MSAGDLNFVVNKKCHLSMYFVIFNYQYRKGWNEKLALETYDLRSINKIKVDAFVGRELYAGLLCKECEKV